MHLRVAPFLSNLNHCTACTTALQLWQIARLISHCLPRHLSHLKAPTKWAWHWQSSMHVASGANVFAATHSNREHRDRKRDRERERGSGRGKGSEKKTRKTAWKSNKIRQADLLELNWIFLLLFFHCRPSHFFIFLRIDFLQRNLTSNNHISCNLFVCQLKFKANVRWLTLTVDCWFLFFFLSLFCLLCFFLVAFAWLLCLRLNLRRH